MFSKYRQILNGQKIHVTSENIESERFADESNFGVFARPTHITVIATYGSSLMGK